MKGDFIYVGGRVQFVPNQAGAFEKRRQTYTRVQTAKSQLNISKK